jgi:hypothetical protein
MGYSNGRFTQAGRFSAPNERQLGEQYAARLDESALLRDSRSEEAVRAYYTRATGSRVKSFGPTSFDVGLGLNDHEAFDACVENFGFVPAVRALKLVSKRAKECDAAYWRRREQARRSP